MSFDLLEHLPVVFFVDHIEATLFRPEADIRNETGVWAPFVYTLLSLQGTEGGYSGMKWQWGYDTIYFHHPKKFKGVNRTGRWLTFQRDGECEKRVIVALVPHVYKQEREFLHLDYRFVVATDDDTLIPLLLLLRDELTEMQGV